MVCGPLEEAAEPEPAVLPAAVLLEEPPPQAVRAAAEPAIAQALRKLRREIIFFMVLFSFYHIIHNFEFKRKALSP